MVLDKVDLIVICNITEAYLGGFGASAPWVSLKGCLTKKKKKGKKEKKETKQKGKRKKGGTRTKTDRKVNQHDERGTIQAQARF